MRYAMFVCHEGPTVNSDRSRINMCVDLGERAVCRADPISFLSSQLNSLCLDKNIAHNTSKFNLNL